VSLVDISGTVVASATPSSPLPVTCGDAAAALVPLPVSTSATRAYFLDAQGNIRFLTPNGETGIEAQVPTGGNTRTFFAVRQDDAVMAVVLADFTSTVATTTLSIRQMQPVRTQMATVS